MSKAETHMKHLHYPQTIGFSLLILLVVTLTTPVYGTPDSWKVTLKPYDNTAVKMKKELFSPTELPILSGDKVTWVNHDSTSHRIVSGLPSQLNSSGVFFRLPVMEPGNSFTIPVVNQGYGGYYYFCEIHPWYTGKIFFEDAPGGMPQSTLEFTSETNSDSTEIVLEGKTHSDFAKTQYEIVIFDKNKNILYHDIGKFSDNSTLTNKIDSSSLLWNNPKYTAKLIYGVPTESATSEIILSQDGKNTLLKAKASEICKKNTLENDIVLDNLSVPKWFQKPLCWLKEGKTTSTDIFNAITYLNFKD